ncbi:MAG: hypothetical protein IPP30_14400 [Flavobacterium sp.]|nr:hypothetical protein [Flavobacterium sp.]
MDQLIQAFQVTHLGITTIYVYAETTAVPACEYEISFTVDIQDLLIAPAWNLLLRIHSITNLTSPFNYYEGPVEQA